MSNEKITCDPLLIFHIASFDKSFEEINDTTSTLRGDNSAIAIPRELYQPVAVPPVRVKLPMGLYPIAT